MASEDQDQHGLVPERQAATPLPPAEVPPPHTDAGLVVLLDILRRRAQGSPAWILPRYVIHGVDIYSRHPLDLLRGHPSATSPDGRRACYFLNLVRPMTLTDPRRSRVVPGGFWKSERAPVPVEAAPDKIVGTKQTLSFISKEGEDTGAGFVMYELLLPGQAGRRAGGDELALSKIFPTLTLRVDKKRPQGQGSTASSAPAPTSSAPLLQRRPVSGTTRSSSSAASSPSPLLQAPPSSAPLLQRRPVSGTARSSSSAASSPPPLLQAPPPAPTSSAPASSLALQHATASSSSSQPPVQGPAFSAQPPPRQGGAKRVLLLEVGDSPPREGSNFSCHQVYRAMEVLGPGNRVPIDCGDLILLDSGKGKRQRTAAEF